MAISVRQMVFTVIIYSFAVTGIVILIFFGHTNTDQYKTRNVHEEREESYQDTTIATDTDLFQSTLTWTSKTASSEERYPGTDTLTWSTNTTSGEERFPGTDTLTWSTNTTSGDGRSTRTITQQSNPTKTTKTQNLRPLVPAHMIDCPEFSPMLWGRLKVDGKFVPSEQQAIENAGPLLSPGGCYELPYCKPDQTVAIIIPYKNREKHLYTLLYHLHPMVQRQWIRYCVFVAEQYDDGAFNKARIMNAVFLEITKQPKRFDCVIFHDVDMLPEDDRNIYKCADTVKHLSPALDKFNYKANYGTHFGGVGAVRVKHYRAVNGHSNRFYGWGGEDSDIENRYKMQNLSTVWNEEYGRYKMIPHEHPWYFNPLTGIGSHFTRTGVRRYEDEDIFRGTSDPSGVNSIKYSLIKTTRHRLYTKLTIDIRTILVNKATVKFVNHTSSAGIENPWFTNNRFGSSFLEDKIRGYGVLAGDRFPNNGCYYKRFEGKTVNKTVVLKKTQIFTDLQHAEARCTELGRYCQSIVEEYPKIYTLRPTAFMHETVLRYKFGIWGQTYVTETHADLSVHVKICPKDARYQQFIETPVVIYGSVNEGPTPKHQVDLELQLYKVENIVLNYTIKVYTAHKAALKELEFVRNGSQKIWDSLCINYKDSVLIANLSDADSVKPFLPEGVGNLEQLLAKKDPVLHLRSPPINVPRMPGCYICTSTITDQTGAQHISWTWWYELRGNTKNLEESLIIRQLIKGEVGSTELTEGVNKWQMKMAMEKAKGIVPPKI